MRLVTQTDVMARTFGDEEAVRLLAKAGYDGIDWSFFPMNRGECIWNTDAWEQHARDLKAIADDCGVVITQAHAPFPSSKGEEPYDAEILEAIKRSMHASAIMGVEHIIVHPRQHLPYEANKEQLWQENLEFYRSLLPYCEEWGIRICTENMWKRDPKRGYIIPSMCSLPETFNAMIDEVNSPWLVGCLDLGHCGLVGIEPQDFIRAMGAKRLRALHVHDVDYLRDCHTMPFIHNLEWEPITQALADIGYEGDFTLEADNFFNAFPDEMKLEASTFMAKTARYLMGRIEAKKADK